MFGHLISNVISPHPEFEPFVPNGRKSLILLLIVCKFTEPLTSFVLLTQKRPDFWMSICGIQNNLTNPNLPSPLAVCWEALSKRIVSFRLSGDTPKVLRSQWLNEQRAKLYSDHNPNHVCSLVFGHWIWKVHFVAVILFANPAKSRI